MFFKEIERVAKIVKSVLKEKNVKIIAQFDTDGITAASILIKALIREDANFSLRIVKQLTNDVINNLVVSEDDLIIFVDCGSGQLDRLTKILEKTIVLILDHHEPVRMNHINLFHINPIIFGVEELSSSIICYLFAKSLNIKNTDTIDLSIIGAIGDEQEEKWEFHGILKDILEESKIIGKVSVTKGLRLYGRNSRPIHKALAYSFEPYIPGISGSESKAVQFLSEIGIDVKADGEWKKLSDLTVEEQKLLASAIIRERLNELDVADIFGDVYTLVGKPKELQDAREFATLINACGRTGNPEVGIRLCLGDYGIIEKSWKVLEQYRRMISNALNLVRENNLIKSTENFNFLIAGDRISDSIIGTTISILLNSNLIKKEKPIFGFADASDSMVKVSARVGNSIDVDLKKIISEAVKRVGGEGGGHKQAAGALIPKGKVEEFIYHINSLLGETNAKES